MNTHEIPWSEIIPWVTWLRVSVYFVPGAIIGTILMHCLKLRTAVKTDQAYVWLDILISVLISLFFAISYALIWEELKYVFWASFVTAFGGTPFAIKLRKNIMKNSDSIIDGANPLKQL